MIYPACLLVFILNIFLIPAEQPWEEIDLKVYFDEYKVDGCFSLYYSENNRWIKYNGQRCRERFIPKSTFKIPHAIIALEEGILEDEYQVIRWDGTHFPFETWNQDQTLATALKYSCVWFFSELTEQIDSLTYKNYLNRFQYGNRDIFGPPQHFWLYGKLKISADEQIGFLQRLYFRRLGISDRSTNLVIRLIEFEHSPDYTIYGKTGGGPIAGGSTLMWLVGFVKKRDHVYFFAMNFDCSEYNQEYADARLEITRSVLKELGIL